MTYRQEMGRLSRALAKLLGEGGTVPMADVPVAVAGQSSVIGLLRAVQADLAATEWRGVTNLSTELARQPRVTDQPLTTVLQVEPTSRAGRLWRDVAKAATVAEHDWHQSTLALRPFGAAAWSEIADVAVMAEAVGLLDGDIADSLNKARRWRDAAEFRASQPGLIALALRAHADGLAKITGHSKRIAPLRMGSGKAIAQATAIHRVLRNMELRGEPMSARLARPVAKTLPQITKALTDAADRQIKRGLWLLSREGNGPLRWTPSLGTRDEPRILVKLHHANEHGQTLTNVLDRVPKDAKPKPKRQPSPIPRKVLADPLAKRGSPVPIVKLWAEGHRRR